MDYWEMLETDDRILRPIADLVSHSLNYDYQKGTPLSAFLDLIGFAHEHYGGVQTPHDFELDLISCEIFADALVSYGNNPETCHQFLYDLENAEQ